MQPGAFAVAVCFLASAATLSLPPAHAQRDGEVTAPFVTTPMEVVDRMLGLAGTGSADYVVDLGSGDGRIVIAAAQKFGARGLGLEIDPQLVEKSRLAAGAAGVAGRTEFRVQDVMRADFSQASVVTVYLLPSLMADLAPVFLDGLKPGSRVVTHAFTFPGWKPDRIEKVKLTVAHPMQGDESTIFLWVVPAKARGLWRARSQDGDWRIRINQNFQEIEIEAVGGNDQLVVSEARLEGLRIRFSGTRGGAQFNFAGRVEADRIAGEVELFAAGSKRSVQLVFVR